MDCITDRGDVFIGYAATLKWRSFTLNYTSVLQRVSDGQPETRTSLLKFSAPKASKRFIEWSSEPLSIKGTWNARSEPIQQTLYKTESGTIEWNCVQPASNARVVSRGFEFDGAGYVEHISISIPPWQLPINELRWGRHIADGSSLIWIDWKGPHPLCLVFHKGLAVEGARVTDNEVAFHGGRMMIVPQTSQVLREGPLISTALSMIPGIGSFVPLRMLSTYESKWCSEGVLETAATNAARACVIHETVRWGSQEQQ
ncbi:MAG: hypothetical protein WBD22_08830 [Pyrinomonadaceae bacterium]